MPEKSVYEDYFVSRTPDEIIQHIKDIIDDGDNTSAMIQMIHNITSTWLGNNETPGRRRNNESN